MLNFIMLDKTTSDILENQLDEFLIKIKVMKKVKGLKFERYYIILEIKKIKSINQLVDFL